MSYVVQQLIGYTDGRPSWRKVAMPRCYTKEDAQQQVVFLKREHPHGTFRVRKKKPK